MNFDQTFLDLVARHPNAAHSLFTSEDPYSWSVFPAGSCERKDFQMEGWCGPVSYTLNGEQYEAFGRLSTCGASMQLFLDEWGVFSGDQIEVACPNCGEKLVVPRMEDGQHFRCSSCDSKFAIYNGDAVAIPRASQDPNAVLHPRLVDDGDARNAESRQATYFMMEKIRDSKDLFKYVRLFSLAPISVKIATVFVLIQVFVDVMLRVDPKGVSTTYSYAFAFVTLYLLSGVLKGRVWSRWMIVTIRGLAVLAAPLFYMGVIKSSTFWESSFYSEKIWSCIGTAITSIPYLVALFMPSANRWFNGYVSDMSKLRQAVDDNMRPTTFRQVCLIVAVFVALVLGKAFLMPVVQKMDGNAEQIAAETATLNKLSHDHKTRADANRFGEVLEDPDLLYARKDVAKTRWRIKDAKEFLGEAVSKAKSELECSRKLESKSSQYLEFNKERNRALNLMLPFYEIQLAMVEQAEKIFYSSLIESSLCPEDERRELERKYGAYSHFYKSPSERRKLVELNDEMLKMVNELRLLTK